MSSPSYGEAFIDGTSCPDGWDRTTGYPDTDASPVGFPDAGSYAFWGTSASATFRATHAAKTPGGAGFSGNYEAGNYDYQPEVKPHG